MVFRPVLLVNLPRLVNPVKAEVTLPLPRAAFPPIARRLAPLEKTTFLGRKEEIAPLTEDPIVVKVPSVAPNLPSTKEMVRSPCLLAVPPLVLPNLWVPLPVLLLSCLPLV